MKTKKNGISFKSKYGWISLIELNNKITELSFKKNNILCTQLLQDLQKLNRLIVINKS